MGVNRLNSGIVYTKSNCIGCNKCISCCIVPGANVVVKEGEDHYTVKVDPKKCILCGQCIKACVHNARTYRDDTERFFHDLERGDNISILVAPSLLTNYEKQYHNILGYLKSRGINHIYNVSFGADLMTWAYVNFIRSFGLSGVISQSCPVIVSYLEKYKPQLLRYLMPVQSPMICTAIYVSDYLKISDKLAFIGPCIAKKHEMEDVNTYGKVSYNVTFERLMQHIGSMNLSGYYAEDEVPYGLGVLVPRAGGLSANIEMYIGFDEVLIKTSGPNSIFPYFDHYYSVINSGEELPFLVDAMSCTNGCYFGTGTSCGVELNNNITFATHRSKERAYRSGLVPVGSGYEERLSLLNNRFCNFALSSFVRQYGQTRRVEQRVLTEEEYEDVFQSMYKFNGEQRHVDCGSCGYKTCRDMAYAVGTRVNIKENCISYSKEQIRREAETTNKLVREMSEMNEELLLSAQMKSDFLANMSHEIRTPMNTVIGMAEMALRGDLPEVEKGYIQQIKSSGRSLLAIINDILDFSKIESGKMELNETEYSALPLIRDMIDTALTRIGERKVKLVVEVDPDIPEALYGDDIRIKQVISNLVSNAAKFTKRGFVRLKFGFTKEGDRGTLLAEVSDSGIGIKEEDMNKLFTSFQQLDSKRNRNIEGTGLGLAISKEFIKLMNGDIQVESVYGQGSAFSIAIPQRIRSSKPCVDREGISEITTACFIRNPYVKESFLKAARDLGIDNKVCSSQEELEEACRKKTDFIFVGYHLFNGEMEEITEKYPDTELVLISDARKDLIGSDHLTRIFQPVYCQNLAAVLKRDNTGFMDTDSEILVHFEAPEARILVVDDNIINLTVAVGLLMPYKMKVDTARGAMEALTLIQNNHYDIIFMDHMMPGIDGVEATHMIRNLEGEYYKRVPVIALTANAVNNARQMFLDEGMNDFVAKPIDMVDISTKLRRWLPDERVVDSRHEGRKPKKEPPEEKQMLIEGIDVNSGLAYTGGMDIYQKALQDYYQTIEEKAVLIEDYWRKEDYASYTIEVHALKSASKLIGANELSEMAARLEGYGKEKKAKQINGETEALLQRYRSYLPILKPFCQTAEEEEASLDSKACGELLKELYKALNDFDIDSAKVLTARLKGFIMPENQEVCFQELHRAVKNLEYEEALQAVSKWLLALDQTEERKEADGG